MFFLSRSRKFKARRCPHVHLQSLHGDVVEAVGGFRLQCTDCWRYLDGPVQLAWVDRDPTGLVDSQYDWKHGKSVGTMKKVFRTSYSTNVDVELDEEELNSAGWIYVGKGNTNSGEGLRDAIEVWHNDSHGGAFRWCENTVCREARV